MTETNVSTTPSGLAVGPRVIPVPTSISEAAQAFLRTPPQTLPPYPPLHDKAAWRAMIAEMNAAMSAAIEPMFAGLPVAVETRTIAGVTVYVARPPSIPEANRDKAIVYFHGGGLVLLAGRATELFTGGEAMARQCTVFGVDYRNPPDHPYPAAIDDCIAVYREVIKDYGAKNVAVSGTSGGGNLAAAVPLKLRDLGLPLPAAALLLTPEVDLTESGDTFQTNLGIDTVLVKGLPEFNLLYADRHDLSHPYLSPLFGDFTNGFPPTFIQTGTRDLFLSNSVRMHRALRRAGIEAELHVWEAMPHGGFALSPEMMEMAQEISIFLAKHWGR